MAMTIHQQPSGKAYARTPVIYLINDAAYAEAGAFYTAKIFVWAGTIASPPGTANYELKKLPDTNGDAVFNIQNILKSWFKDLPLTQPYLESEDLIYNVLVKFYFESSITTSALRATSDTIQTVYGYSSYLGGINYYEASTDVTSTTYEYIKRVEADSGVVDTSSCLTAMDDDDIIEFHTDRPYAVTLPANARWTLALDYSTAALATEIYLFNNLSESTPISFGPLILADTAEKTLIQAEVGLAANTNKHFSEDTEWYYAVVRDASGTELSERMYFYIDEACKWGYLNLAFINRFGVWDYVQFWARKDTSYSIEKEEFMRSGAEITSSTLTYLVQGQYVPVNIKGRTSMKVNTGYINENMSAVVQQLLLSDNVRDADTGEPYTIKSKSETYKVNPNERLINYTLDVEKAYSLLNTVT